MCSSPCPSATPSEADKSTISSLRTSSPSAAPTTSTPYPYTKILTLLLCWEDEQDGVWGEITDLQSVFVRDFNFEADIYRIPSKNPESNLLDKIQELKEKAEEEESLVIVYHGGYGVMVPSKENKPSFEWHALGPEQLMQLYTMAARMLPGPQILALHNWMSPVRWEVVEKALETIPSDLLILIDSCDASAAVTQIKQDNSCRRIDFITACGSHNFTTPLPRRTYDNRFGGTFTDILIHILRQKSHIRDDFTAANLHFGLMQRMAEINVETKNGPPTPFYFSVGALKGMQEPSVRLKVLERNPEETGDGKTEVGEDELEGMDGEMEELEMEVSVMTIQQGPDAKKVRKASAHTSR